MGGNVQITYAERYSLEILIENEIETVKKKNEPPHK